MSNNNTFGYTSQRAQSVERQNLEVEVLDSKLALELVRISSYHPCLTYAGGDSATTLFKRILNMNVPHRNQKTVFPKKNNMLYKIT